MIKNKFLKIFLLIIQSIGSYLLTIRIIYNNISFSNLMRIDIWLFALIWFISFIVLLHFFMPLKDLYNKLYKYRYMLSLILFILLVLGKFNGSSYGMWDSAIEPNYPSSSLKPLIGTPRGIRSDEWFVNSPHVLSEITNNFNYWNEDMRATKTDVFSTLPVPVKSILIITKPFLIGYLFLGRDYGMSIYWWGRLIVLFLSTYELLMLLIKKKKLPALIGSILITFSPAVFWWYSQYLIELLIGANLSILFFNALLKSSCMKKKIIYSILLGWSFSIFFFTLYPAWMVPLAYLYLLLALYILYKEKKNITLKNLSPLIISIIIFGSLVGLYFNKSLETFKIIGETIYPGKRFSVGGSGSNLFFYYPATIFFPYQSLDNPCEASTFYSFFPLVLIMAIYILIKERKKLKDNWLLLSLVLLVLLFYGYTLIKIPSILANISLMHYVPGERISVIASYICILIALLLWNKDCFQSQKEKIIWLIISIILMFLTGLIVKYNISNNYLSNNIKWLLMVIVSLIPVICFIYKNKVSKYILGISILLISFTSTIKVNPLMKGFSGVYDKPIAKELSKYQDGTWLVLDSFTLPNYFLLNGLKVINSTNVYPNFSFYQAIDQNNKYFDLYNRYAHVQVTLTNKDTIITAPYNDQVHITLNKKEVCNLNINYIGSYLDINNLSDKNIKFEELYHKDNIYLYQVNCSK